jgi:hypothetical protein
MHPLIPDDYQIREIGGAVQEEHEFLELHGLHSRELLQRVPAAAAMYSLGAANPGAITLHNHPRFMHRLMRTDGIPIDLGTIDILRSRERGCRGTTTSAGCSGCIQPRRSTRSRTATRRPRNSCGRSMGTDLEKVDCTVGMFGERSRRASVFSDTAFPHLRAHGLTTAQE